MSDCADSPTDPPRRAARRIGLGPIAAGVGLGVFLTVAAGVLLFIWYYREPTPLLTQQAFDEALARWHNDGPESYDAALRVTTDRSSDVQVEVRGGRVTSAAHDGRLLNEVARAHWSVDALFEMIGRDLENAANPQPVFGVSDPAQVLLRAEFDPELGYPRKYQRFVIGTGRAPGSGEMRWEVTGFEPRAQAKE